MRRRSRKYGDYVEIGDGCSVLDGYFSATVLREIADDMDKLALKNPHSITAYPPVAFVQTANNPECRRALGIYSKDLSLNHVAVRSAKDKSPKMLIVLPMLTISIGAGLVR